MISRQLIRQDLVTMGTVSSFSKKMKSIDLNVSNTIQSIAWFNSKLNSLLSDENRLSLKIVWRMIGLWSNSLNCSSLWWSSVSVLDKFDKTYAGISNTLPADHIYDLWKRKDVQWIWMPIDVHQSRTNSRTVTWTYCTTRNSQISDENYIRKEYARQNHF
jgi:hypothetical protein